MLTIVTFFYVIRLNAQSNRDSERTRQLSEQNQVLLEQVTVVADQAKDIAEQNQKLSQENQDHIDCIAKLFARYTRNGLPITDPDLSKCQADEIHAIAESQSNQSGSSTPNTRNQSSSSIPANDNNKGGSDTDNGVGTDNDNGGSTNEDTSYLACVGNGDGIFNTLGKVVGCI